MFPRLHPSATELPSGSAGMGRASTELIVVIVQNMIVPTELTSLIVVCKSSCLLFPEISLVLVVIYVNKNLINVYNIIYTNIYQYII